VSERFNFYDIYGYLIPGLALLTLLWLPFAMINPGLMKASLAAAAAAVVVGYIVGHFVAATAGDLISAKTARAQDGKPEYPSIVLLNPSDHKLSRDLKKRLARLVWAQFSLDLHLDKEADKEIGEIRQAAFYLCRPIVNKVTAYPEQFQGLYAMMSALTIVFALGFFYMLGWSIAAYWVLSPAGTVAQFGVALLLFATIVYAAGGSGMPMLAVLRQRMPWLAALQKRVPILAVVPKRARLTALAILALLLALSGYSMGTQAAVPTSFAPALLAIALLCLAASFRFYSQYGYFANEFAKSVWTYFPPEAVREKSTP
jgi:hypothetical protein